MLRIFFKYNRRLLGELMPGVIAAIQTFGDRINVHPHRHFLVTEGRLGRPSRNISWPQRPRLNSFLSLLLPWGGELWRISGSFALSAGSWLALHHLELNLTSDNLPI